MKFEFDAGIPRYIYQRVYMLGCSCTPPTDDRFLQPTSPGSSGGECLGSLGPFGPSHRTCHACSRRPGAPGLDWISATHSDARGNRGVKCPSAQGVSSRQVPNIDAGMGVHPWSFHFNKWKSLEHICPPIYWVPGRLLALISLSPPMAASQTSSSQEEPHFVCFVSLSLSLSPFVSPGAV